MKVFLGLLLSWIVSFTLHAQTVKIGYTNVEFIMTYMPEAKQMESTLKTLETKLKEQLRVKQIYAQDKLEEFSTLAEQKKLTPAEEESRKKELIRLDEEIKKFTEDAENTLLDKREELLKPIIDKLQKEIDAIAKEEGYTHILNNTNSGGVATILYGIPTDNITEKLMKRLGISVPTTTK